MQRNDYCDQNSQEEAISINKTTWTVAEAKAKLSKVIEQARLKGPQTITRNGHTAVVLVSIEEWERKTKRIGSLAEFFAGSPLRGSDLSVVRSPETPRGSRPVSFLLDSNIVSEWIEPRPSVSSPGSANPTKTGYSLAW